MLLSKTVTYLNSYILPGLTTIVCAGLLLRMITKIQKARDDENDSLGSVSRVVRKYISLMIITVVIQEFIKVLKTYYGL